MENSAYLPRQLPLAALFFTTHIPLDHEPIGPRDPRNPRNPKNDGEAKDAKTGIEVWTEFDK